MRAAASVGSRRARAASASPPSWTAARSNPDENDRPSPRTTTTRTSPGSSAPKARSASQVRGVCALWTSGRHSVTVATGPSRSNRTPATPPDAPPGPLPDDAPGPRSGAPPRGGGPPGGRGGVACPVTADPAACHPPATSGSGAAAGRAVPGTGVRPCPSRSRLLAAAGATPLAQLHPGLGQHAVHEPVGAPGGRGERSDALTVGVAADQVLGERLALRPDDPAPLLGACRGAGGSHDRILTYQCRSGHVVRTVCGHVHWTTTNDHAPAGIF